MEQPLNTTVLNTQAPARATSGPAAEPIELSASSSTSPLKWLLPTLAAVLAMAVGIRRLRK